MQINYQSIGSGGGVQQVKNGTVDFGASDAPLNDDQLNGMKPMIQIPESAGPVCITYSLPGVNKPVQLSSNAIAGIFLGKITSWRDPILLNDNPGVALPDTKIAVSHRTDGSGTTNAFTAYLSAVSPEWQLKVGQGNSVNWPAGMGGREVRVSPDRFVKLLELSDTSNLLSHSRTSYPWLPLRTSPGNMYFPTY